MTFPVVRINCTTKVIEKWYPSMAAAAADPEVRGTRSGMSEAISGVRATHRGYVWRKAAKNMSDKIKCPSCKELLPRPEFYKSIRRNSGVSWLCKECEKERQRLKYAETAKEKPKEEPKNEPL